MKIEMKKRRDSLLYHQKKKTRNKQNTVQTEIYKHIEIQLYSKHNKTEQKKNTQKQKNQKTKIDAQKKPKTLWFNHFFDTRGYITAGYSILVLKCNLSTLHQVIIHKRLYNCELDILHNYMGIYHLEFSISILNLMLSNISLARVVFFSY